MAAVACTAGSARVPEPQKDSPEVAAHDGSTAGIPLRRNDDISS